MKKVTDPKFLPCVSTHYRNVMLTKLKQVTDIQESISEHNGHLVPGLMESLDSLVKETTRVLEILNTNSSKPL